MGFEIFRFLGFKKSLVHTVILSVSGTEAEKQKSGAYVSSRSFFGHFFVFFFLCDSKDSENVLIFEIL